MSYCIVIPARLKSTRLENKLLLRVAERSILEHTWRRAMQTKAARIVVATDAPTIAEEVNKFGGEALMTDVALSSGTERVHQAAERLGLTGDQLLINVQADEPLIEPSLIDDLANFAEQRTGDQIATASWRVEDPQIYQSDSIVKLVCDCRRRALYFSRRVIPWAAADDPPLPIEAHIGLYGYRLEYLRQFVGYPVSPLEKMERLEQLRALWYGDSIAVLDGPYQKHIGIDTAADLQQFKQLLSHHSTL